MKQYLALFLAACTITMIFGGCGDASTGGDGSGGGDNVILTMGTGDVGGTLYPVGAAIGKAVSMDFPNIKINIETTSGSPDNARMTNSGEVNLGLCTGDVAVQAVMGTDTFDGQAATQIRALYATFPSVSMWMALEESGLEYVHELEGQKASVGMAGSAAEVAAGIIFTSMGIDYPGGLQVQYLGVGEGCDAVRDGIIAAHHAFGGFPQGGMLDLSNTKNARLLKYTDAELDKLTGDYAYYYRATIPANTYKNQGEDMETFGVKCMLICSADMDDDLAYSICKASWENREELVAGHASLEAMVEAFVASDMPIELHPGAIRYWQEIGVLS